MQDSDLTPGDGAAGIRILPAQAPRVETGPVQFGDDWPGVFIRGDNAFGYVGVLDALLRRADDGMQRILIQGLRDVLASSDLTGLSKRAAMQASPAPAVRLSSLRGLLRPDQVAPQADPVSPQPVAEEFAMSKYGGTADVLIAMSKEIQRLRAAQEPADRAALRQALSALENAVPLRHLDSQPPFAELQEKHSRAIAALRQQLGVSHE